MAVAAQAQRPLQPWLWVALGAAALYLPSYWDAAQGLWQTDEFGHAPLILGIAAWLFWQTRHAVDQAPDAPRLCRHQKGRKPKRPLGRDWCRLEP
mgnify:CR=1 FL=1